MHASMTPFGRIEVITKFRLVRSPRYIVVTNTHIICGACRTCVPPRARFQHSQQPEVEWISQFWARCINEESNRVTGSVAGVDAGSVKGSVREESKVDDIYTLLVIHGVISYMSLVQTS